MCGHESGVGTRACLNFGETLSGNAMLESDEKIWRWGELLVMSKRARLPDRCVKSNQPTGLRFKRSLSWHHPANFLALCIGILVYFFLAVVLRKTAKIEVGLSKEWFSRRRWALALGWLFGLGSLSLIPLGIQLNDPDLVGWFVVVGIVGALVALVLASMRASIVTPYKITNKHIFLKGVHPDYLATLPVWDQN